MDRPGEKLIPISRCGAGMRSTHGGGTKNLQVGLGSNFPRRACRSLLGSQGSITPKSLGIAKPFRYCKCPVQEDTVDDLAAQLHFHTLAP